MLAALGDPWYTNPPPPNSYLSQRAVHLLHQLQLVLRHGLVELVERVGIREATEAAEAAVARQAVVPTLLDRVSQKIQIQNWPEANRA